MAQADEESGDARWSYKDNTRAALGLFGEKQGDDGEKSKDQTRDAVGPGGD